MYYLLILLSAFLGSYVVIAWLLKLPANMAALDQPNHRSLHAEPVSRLGGIGILTGLLIALGLMLFEFVWEERLLLVAGGLMIVSLISFADDIYSLGGLIRIIAHTTAGALVVYAGFVIEPVWLPWLS